MINTGVVIRPAALTDLKSLHALALSAGLGMTNLPPCRERLLGSGLIARIARWRRGRWRTGRRWGIGRIGWLRDASLSGVRT